VLNTIFVEHQFLINRVMVKSEWNNKETSVNFLKIQIKLLEKFKWTDKKAFKILPINFLAYSASKLDQRMLSSLDSTSAIKRWEIAWTFNVILIVKIIECFCGCVL
jgi:hypothetical protein